MFSNSALTVDSHFSVLHFFIHFTDMWWQRYWFADAC